MFKWIIGAITLYAGIGFVLAYNSEYTPISKQIDLKTMSLTRPDFITATRNSCVGSCRNFSSSSSYGSSGSFGGK